MIDTSEGTLLVTFLSASLQRDTELIGQMDPFVEVRIGDIVQRTSTHSNGGKTPLWQEQMVFRSHPA